MTTGAGVESGNGRGTGAAQSRFGPGALGRAFAGQIAASLAQRRGFLLFPFTVMTGMLVYRGAGAEPAFPVLVVLVVLSLLWLLLVIQRRGDPLVPLLVFGLSVGFALLPLHGALFGTRMLSGAAYGTYQARIDTLLDASPSGQRVIVTEIDVLDGRDPDVRRARLFVRAGPALQPGDLVAGRMRFAEVPGPAAPGGYDAQFSVYFEGIGAYGTVLGELEVVGRAESGLAGLVTALRQGIGRRIDAVLADTEAAVARALSIGDQSRIGDETRRDMAVAGIAHVLAISGLHLTLVAGAAFAAIRLLIASAHGLAQRVAVKKIAAAGGVIVVLVYLAISGASVSATRASVMLILVFGAMLAGRRALTMRNVAFAALFVLAVEPTSLFRPGFQLSFAAVAALIGTYETVRQGERGPVNWPMRVVRFFIGLSVTSLVAGLATGVFAAYHFQQTAPLGLLGNLMALPVLAFFVLPSLALGVLVMPLGLEAPLLSLAGQGITLIIESATLIARLSDAIAYRPLLSSVVLLFAFGAAAWFVFFTSWLRLIGPVLAAALILLFGPAPVPDVLIADSTKAVGIRTGEQLALMSGRSGSFVTNVWSDTYGFAVAEGGNAIACDAIGCIGTLPGGARVAVENHIAGFAEDCDQVALVVARITAPDWCRDLTDVVDLGDLRRGGVTAAYWQPDKGTFRITPSISDIGRPWRIAR